MGVNGTAARAEVDIAAVARLIGEPARAAMLDALLSGRALTAGELARAAGVTPPTASEHLARLLAGELVVVVPAGRHRYYRLASSDVAHVLEGLAVIGRAKPVRSLRESNASAAMLLARTCYDHLAGRLGVAVHDRLVVAGGLDVDESGYVLTGPSERLLTEWGVDLVAARSARRVFVRPCLDFTERRPHLAGAGGAAILRHLLELEWLVPRTRDHRALRLTPAGRAGFATTFGIDVEAATARSS